MESEKQPPRPFPLPCGERMKVRGRKNQPSHIESVARESAR